MAINFWEAQKRARARSSLFFFMFIFMSLLVAFLIELGIKTYATEAQQPYAPFYGFVFLGITYLVAGYYYLLYKVHGGAAIAESLGAIPVESTTADPQAKQLYNIVEEISIASALPIPAVFIIESEQINAFAAGMHPKKAAVTVTRGAIKQLNREELQGVIAHEFGHIYNGDMRISMRLTAMIMGFFIVFYIGLRLLESSFFLGGGRSRGRSKNNGQAIVLFSLALLVAGSVTWLFGSILRSMISREREYLADACAVQFTRNPEGIANALRKIARFEQPHDMPKRNMAFSHLYFDHRSWFGTLFATHPPIEKRIAAIEGRTYQPSEWPPAAS